MFFNPPFLWGLLGVVLIAAEMIIPGFVIFFFGSGALVTALSSGLFSSVESSFAMQGFIWVVSSVLSLVILRRRFSKIFRGTVFNPVGTENVGKTAIVTERITPDKPGRVRYQGTTWKAVSYTETLEPESTVEILQEDNLTMIVSAPIFPEDTSDDTES